MPGKPSFEPSLTPEVRGRLDLEVYTLRELAARLGCTYEALRRAAAAGRLVTVNLGGTVGRGRSSGSGGQRVLRYFVLQYLSGNDRRLLDPLTQLAGGVCPRCGGELLPRSTKTWGPALVCSRCELVVADGKAAEAAGGKA